MPPILFSLYIFYSIVEQTSSDLTFCDLSCIVKNKIVKPTVCRNYPCFVGPSCRKGQESRLSPAEEKLITNIHNYYRHLAASGNLKRNFTYKAANMQALIYDRELSYSAQCHTNSCSMDYDPCGITPKFPRIGQNVYIFNGILRASKISHAFREWSKELEKVNLRLIGNYSVGTYFSLTQLLWANTKYVGCGRTINGERTTLACYYSPPGNIIGESVFDVGLPCSGCIPKSKCRRNDFLCYDDLEIQALREFSGVEKISCSVFFIIFVIFWFQYIPY